MSERVETESVAVGGDTRAFPVGVESVIGGRYRLLRKLGEGGFAYVFEASHVELPDLHYAIKVLRGEHAGEAEVIRKFRHEAVLLSGLKCPQTVRVVDFGITGEGSPFFVMEFVKGVTLETLLARAKRLRATDVARLTMDVLESLDEAHNARIVHRDIKPANILVVPGFAGGHPRAKVLDFGIAKVLAGQGEGAAAANQTVGDFVFCTPLYAPAEVLRRDPKPQSDLYSLGHVMAELLDGTAPFVADVPVMSAYRHLSGEAIALGPHSEASGLAAVIRKATAHKVEERYETAAEMIVALREVMQKLVAAAGSERALPVEIDERAMGESAEQLGAPEIDTSLPAQTDAFPQGAMTGANPANHTPTLGLGGETVVQAKVPASLRPAEQEAAAPPVVAAEAARAVAAAPVGPVTEAVVGQMQAKNRQLQFVAAAVVVAVLAAAGALVWAVTGSDAPAAAPAAAPVEAPAAAAVTAPPVAPPEPPPAAAVAPVEGSAAAAPAAPSVPPSAAPADATRRKPAKAAAPAAQQAPAPAIVPAPVVVPAVEAPKPEPRPEPVVAPKPAEPEPAPKPRLRGRDSIFIPTAPK